MPATRMVVIGAAAAAVAATGLWAPAPALASGPVASAPVAGATVVGATVVGATVVGATVVGSTVVGSTVRAAARPAAAGIGKPVAHGQLRITGRLRDGGTVRAAGLSWQAGSLPKRDKVLSFAVTYTWQSCAAKCVKAADTTATPFAAQRYIAGHADTGRQLRLVETASETVETDPATFSFTQVSASATVTTQATVAAYSASRPPRTEFVNGLPEASTASDAEYLQVDPVHYRAPAGCRPSATRSTTGRGRRCQPAAGSTPASCPWAGTACSSAAPTGPAPRRSGTAGGSYRCRSRRPASRGLAASAGTRRT